MPRAKRVIEKINTDDIGAIPPMDPGTIKKAQLNAADMLGPNCADILDMLGIKVRL